MIDRESVLGLNRKVGAERWPLGQACLWFGPLRTPMKEYLVAIEYRFLRSTGPTRSCCERRLS